MLMVLFLYALLVGIGVSVFQYSRNSFVEKTSVVLGRLRALNRATRERLSDAYNEIFPVVVRCKTKAQFDSRSLYNCLALYMAKHQKHYLPIYEKIRRDRRIYDLYRREYERLQADLGTGWAKSSLSWRKSYDRIERRIFRRLKVPAPGVAFFVRKKYTSPKGRRRYEETESFGAYSFLNICEELFKKAERRKSAESERKKMTPELRYKILRRDGFHCVLCGRSADDGVTLHVDHIRPVAKGGRSTLENLRTLCDTCNLGKGDRFVPGELN